MKLKVSLILGACAAIVGVALPTASLGSSLPTVSVLTTFPAGEVCCGITATNTGAVYVSVTGGSAGSGQIRTVQPNGQQHALLSTPPPVTGGYGPTALAFNPQHRLFMNDANFPVGTGSVYQLGGSDTWTPVPGTGQIGLPDGLTFDSAGNLYVTDNVPGNSKVWRVTPGGTAQVWSDDPLIQGGANSIQIFGNAAYVSVTLSGTMVKIPIEADGSAGAATVIASDPSIAPVDDGAYDPVTGNVYLTSLLGNQFVQITPSGASTVIADGQTDGLYTPTNLAFVQVDGHAFLYVVGTALQAYGAPADATGEILKVTLR